MFSYVSHACVVAMTLSLFYAYISKVMGLLDACSASSSNTDGGSFTCYVVVVELMLMLMLMLEKKLKVCLIWFGLTRHA